MKSIKTILMTIVIFSLTSPLALAENIDDDQSRKHHKKQSSVLLVGTNGGQDIFIVKGRMIDLYKETIKKGFQQSGVPNFIISDPSNRAIFGIGGFVNFRTAYDWNNVIDNKDFVTSDIPMNGTPFNKERLLMDGSTTRLFFKTVVKSRQFGPIEAYIETDFRGYENSLHLREAYISIKGFTVGQTATTFVDLKAAPNTIDFEGPNGYTYSRNLMVRYQFSVTPNWDFAIAAEMPNVSANTTRTMTAIVPQRIPNIPLYVQYNWDGGRSHLRASGVLRIMNYHDDVNMDSEVATGWGTMLSGNIAVHRSVNLFGQVVYGEGVENYIQDLNGRGYDLLPNPNVVGKLQTLLVTAWMAGIQVNCIKNWQMNGAYSQVGLSDKNNYFAQAPESYKLSQYIVVNTFYNITPALSVGIEYLYGTRQNADGKQANANRTQMMAQFNF